MRRVLPQLARPFLDRRRDGGHVDLWGLFAQAAVDISDVAGCDCRYACRPTGRSGDFSAGLPFDLDPAGGVGLIFQVLPVAFGQMPGGVLIATAFFTLLALAAILSLLALSSRWSWRVRQISGEEGRRHTMVGGTATFFHYEHLLVRVAACGSSAGRTRLFVNQIMLPLGGVMVAGFVGWKLMHRLNPESIGVTSPLPLRYGDFSSVMFCHWR